MSEYRKGYRFERRVKKYLEGRGYFVIRAAASKPIDLVVLSKEGYYIIECKTKKRNIRRKDINYLKKIYEAVGVRPVLAYRDKNKIVFLDIIDNSQIDFPYTKPLDLFIGEDE